MIRYLSFTQIMNIRSMKITWVEGLDYTTIAAIKENIKMGGNVYMVGYSRKLKSYILTDDRHKVYICITREAWNKK